MATDTKKRMAGDELEKDTPAAAVAKETVATGTAPSESKGIDAYIDYLNNYDRTARGAGDSRGTDRFSGLDVRHVYDAAKDFGVDKYDAADQVIQYSRRIEDETKMGGASKAALDKLRGILGERPEEATPEPTPEPTPDPEPTPEPTPAPVEQKPQEVNVDFGDGGIRPPAEQPVFGTPGTLPGLAGGQFVMQDNDQQSSVVGDNNTVTQNQDNSVSQWNPGTGSWKNSWMKNYFS